MTHPILSSFPFTTQSVSFSKLAVQALTKSHSSPFPQLCYPKKPPSVCQPREEMGTGVHQLFRDELGWTAPWICAKFPIAYSSCPNQLRGLLPNHLLRPIHWRAQIPPHSSSYKSLLQWKPPRAPEALCWAQKSLGSELQALQLSHGFAIRKSAYLQR